MIEFTSLELEIIMPDVAAPEDGQDTHKSNANSLKPDSPCIGYCSTSFGDDICKGCGRNFLEVIQWNTMDDPAKAVIWARIEAEGTALRFQPNKRQYTP